MPNYTQATLDAVYPAGLVRVGQLALALADEEARPVPNPGRIQTLEKQIIDLRGGLEIVATTGDAVERDITLGYLQSTYGLLAADTDPLLHAAYPAIPATGSVVTQFVLGTGRPGEVLGTGRGNQIIRARVVLTPITSIPTA